MISDFKSRRIPNSIIAVGLGVGIGFAAFSPHSGVTIVQALMGVLAGLIMLMPFYLLGKMGAGDVKLLAMCGSYLGFQTTLMAGFATLMTGGIFALIWVALLKTFPIKDKRYPYAAAIATGTLFAPYLHFN